MRQILFAALAAAAVLARGLLGDRAEAMMPAAGSALGAATADAGLVHRMVNVCGVNGCVMVRTQRAVKRHPPPPRH